MQADRLKHLLADKKSFSQVVYFRMTQEMHEEIKEDIDRIFEEEMITISMTEWIRRACRMALELAKED